MNRKLTLTVIAVSLLLGGCALKDGIFKSKSRSADKGGDATGTELTGMLLVLDPAKCPLADGCGPQFSLLGRKLKSQVAVEGEISTEHKNLVLSVEGEPVPLPVDLAGRSGYDQISALVGVTKYRLRSTIPYYPFLVEKATEYTTKKFGCDLLWDKSYAWNIENDRTTLIIRMTDTFSDPPQPWVELTYDGNTGDLVNTAMEPSKMNPCEL